MSIAGGLIVQPNSAAHEMGDPRARYLILAWHAGDVGTGTPDPSALHDGSPPSGLRHMPSHEFAAGSTAKDHAEAGGGHREEVGHSLHVGDFEGST
jgi:hypothetical protein